MVETQFIAGLTSFATLALFVGAGLTAELGLPFAPGRPVRHKPVHVPSDDRLDRLDSLQWAFEPSKTYTYLSTLNASSDTFDFASQPSGPIGGRINSPESSGFDANVTVQLTINTYPEDQSPEPGTRLLQANITVPQCKVVKGSAIGHKGKTDLRSSDDDKCIQVDDDAPW